MVTGIAAFDFDGTLSRRDTFLPFLAAVGGRTRLVQALAVASATTAAAGPARRDELKAALCRAILRGRTRTELETAGEVFASVVVERGLRADRVARLRWHQDQGHHTVIVSASPDLYLAPTAATLGVDGLECTMLAYADGRATGELAGRNCNGPEKARRLRAWIAAHGLEGPVWAYGDGAGDADLLAMADHPVRVSRRSLAVAPGLGRNGAGIGRG